MATGTTREDGALAQRFKARLQQLEHCVHASHLEYTIAAAAAAHAPSVAYSACKRALKHATCNAQLQRPSALHPRATTQPLYCPGMVVLHITTGHLGVINRVRPADKRDDQHLYDLLLHADVSPTEGSVSRVPQCELCLAPPASLVRKLAPVVEVGPPGGRQSTDELQAAICREVLAVLFDAAEACRVACGGAWSDLLVSLGGSLLCGVALLLCAADNTIAGDDGECSWADRVRTVLTAFARPAAACHGAARSDAYGSVLSCVNGLLAKMGAVNENAPAAWARTRDLLMDETSRGGVFRHASLHHSFLLGHGIAGDTRNSRVLQLLLLPRPAVLWGAPRGAISRTVAMAALLQVLRSSYLD